MTTSHTRKIEYLDVAELQPAERNSKLHDDEGLGESFAAFGFVEPVVLDERTGRLVVGHGRWEKLTAMHAAGELAPEGIKVVGAKWKVPVLRGWASSSDEHAEAYLIASNQLTAKGGWDQAMLVDALNDLQGFDLLELTGFTLEDVSAMAADSKPRNVPDFQPDGEDAKLDETTPKHCPSCEFSWRVGADGEIIPA